MVGLLLPTIGSSDRSDYVILNRAIRSQADRHRRSFLPAGHRPLRPQVRRWFPDIQVDRLPRLRLFEPGQSRGHLLLR